VRSNQVDDQLIWQRKDAFIAYQALTPPRVLTSDGEAVAGVYRRGGVPTGALSAYRFPPGPSRDGLASSWTWPRPIATRTISSSPRTPTPVWTAVFLAIKGLVTEVGELMTHGAVIAWEYGIPAVVGVQDAHQADSGWATHSGAWDRGVRRDCLHRVRPRRAAGGVSTSRLQNWTDLHRPCRVDSGANRAPRNCKLTA
jgi:hypothetical protein